MRLVSPPASSGAVRRVMQGNRGSDTKPELVVRRLVHKLGYRYRLHANHLPGRPDLAFATKRKVIFVHGCFWHQHGCSQCRTPKSNLHYWRPKLERNRLRDAGSKKELRKQKWRQMTVWECELTDLEKLTARVTRFLG
jgi:DNA mismatch endonuclease, patch repair protein